MAQEIKNGPDNDDRRVVKITQECLWTFQYVPCILAEILVISKITAVSKNIFDIFPNSQSALCGTIIVIKLLSSYRTGIYLK